MTSVLVVVKPDQDRDEWLLAMQQAGLSYSEFDALPRIFRVDGVSIVTFPLVNHPGYEILEPADMPVKSASQTIEVDEGLLTARWALARIIRRRAPWPALGSFPQTTYFRCERDGSGVDVYIVDSGVRTTHDEFGGRATNVYDAVGVGPVWFHGTACGTLAVGSTVGVARASLLFSFQCMGADGTGFAGEVVAAMNQALSHYNGRSALNRPAVINMSLISGSSTINSVITSMIDAGMVVVACAGNDFSDLSTVTVYPAESDADVIVVGGTTARDTPYRTVVSGSNYGSRVDLCAPSQSIYFATNTGDSDYTPGPGTSYGTGITSGAIACMLQGHPRLTTRVQVQAVRNFVMSTATTGKVQNTITQTLPDRLLYLNPNATAPEAITGL